MHQPRRSELWSLVRRQHGVVPRGQLLELGFTSKAIEHRLRAGRLLRVRQGVYAVGLPWLTQHGRWMAAVLSCGPDAFLSHGDAAGEETYEAGDAYFAPPGHTPVLYAGTEVVEFSPTEELQQTIDVVSKNMESAAG